MLCGEVKVVVAVNDDDDDQNGREEDNYAKLIYQVFSYGPR